MPTLSIDVPAGDRSTTLAAAAAEAGYPATAAGVKAMALAWLREVYRRQKALEAQRSVQATIDAAVTAAQADAGTIA